MLARLRGGRRAWQALLAPTLPSPLGSAAAAAAAAAAAVQGGFIVQGSSGTVWEDVDLTEKEWVSGRADVIRKAGAAVRQEPGGCCFFTPEQQLAGAQPQGEGAAGGASRWRCLPARANLSVRAKKARAYGVEQASNHRLLRRASSPPTCL